MVNQIEETPVQLAGKGVVHKPRGKFLPGEYEILDNLDISPDGTIVNRRGFTWSDYDVLEGPYAELHKNASRFVGFFGPCPVVATYDTNLLYLVADYNAASAHAASSLYLQADFNPDVIFNAIRAALPSIGAKVILVKNESIDGFWQYNDFNHFLVTYYEVSRTAPAVTDYTLRFCTAVYRVHKFYSITDQPRNYIEDATDNADPNVLTFLDSGLLNVGSWNASTLDTFFPPFHRIKNHLIHKDRAWVASVDTVYFSSASDHSVWAAPDGGFIKFPDNEIKQIYALGDIIYVLTDAKIYAVTYGTDFNVDGEVSIISPEVGGEWACSLGDTIYSIKGDSLYSINGNNVTKAFDLPLNLRFDRENTSNNLVDDGQSTGLKIGIYDHELYVFMYTVRSSFDLIDGNFYWRGVAFNDELISSSNAETDLFKVNLETGTISRVNLAPSFGATNSTVIPISSVNSAIPIDCIFIPAESIHNNHSSLHFLFKHEFDNTNGWAVAHPAPNDLNDYYTGLDIIINWGNSDLGEGNWYTSPEYNFKIKDFSPDELKYNMKKFRSLMFESNLPQINLDNDINLGVLIHPELRVFYGDKTAPVVHSLLEHLSDNVDDSRGYRYPINQRARFLSFQFFLQSQVFNESIWGTQDPTPISSRLFEMSDFRVLWTPIGRSVVSNTSSNT